MLSQKNIDKLCLNGLYVCKPVLEWLPSYRRSEPYHCMNWTFKVRHSGDSYYMVDTYWSSNSFSMELNDDNFDKFALIFNYDDVEETNYKWDDYSDEDKWIVPTDSGGWRFPRKYIKIGAKPDRDKVIYRLENEIKSLEIGLETKRKELEQIKERLS